MTTVPWGATPLIDPSNNPLLLGERRDGMEELILAGDGNECPWPR
jgi:hypothetical protein